MPTPNADENHSDYMGRCVPMMMDEGKDQDQAVAICSSMWEDKAMESLQTRRLRAFSLLNVKSVDDQRRVITGIASTPTVDRVGDSVDPMGAKFKTPMPLLLYHQSDKPVGTVDFARPTRDGIPFSASLPEVKEPGVVQDRVNEAYHSIKYKLLGAVSIGFQPIECGTEVMKAGGFLFKVWEWIELSLVAVPANPEAVILGFKSADPMKIMTALSIPPERPGVVRLNHATIRRAREGGKPGVVYLQK